MLRNSNCGITIARTRTSSGQRLRDAKGSAIGICDLLLCRPSDFFIAGLLTLYPIEAEYCERAKDTKIEHCSKHHIALTTWYYVAFFSHEYHGILTAIATFTIALFTWFLRRSTDELRRSTDNLWEAGERQIAVAKTSADAAAKAADVAEKTLLATHRPKIRIKHVVLSEEREYGEKPTADTHVAANVTLINVGATEATIFEWGIRFLVEQSTRSLPPLSKFAATTNRIEGRFGPGISTTFKNVTDGTVISDALGLEIQARRSTLYCLGYVHYMDAAKGVRTTAFEAPG
jgi:hypothetical protein